ncbi:related to cellulase-Streptomyces pristinaespiralis [Serendipita indica DSM 11827]|uniref:Related to cellulase-Streptomyces pristinaespiralis n=1 Tax=Serendipita indica (strain DSM 11827) TaxID=1109443 RepID=G4TJX5_SERID|nr:related to cellulase-Streptomyces pristinaespiralis [Serendipita indica DSM 11827]
MSAPLAVMIPNSRSKQVLFAFLCVSPVLALPEWTPPLSTRGRYVVDATGARFKLHSGNWHGASGTWTGVGDQNNDDNSHYNENSHNLPLGLQYMPIDTILDAFESLGINSIRLPFSNQMIHDPTPILDYWVAANPQLRGMTPLQVYVECVKALTSRGFAVILNNHTNKNRWCCGVGDGNERWNESQTTQQWADDWVMMVKLFKDNPRVVGADLYNEVRRDVLIDPNWGWGGPVDWQAASQWAGDRILTEANPDILIIIEGINWVGLPVDGLPHGRPTLSGAATISHTLVQSDKLVYAAHFYSYTGPNHSGAFGIGETHDPRYRDLNLQQLRDVVESSATFVVNQPDKHFTRPLWISEFGIPGRGIISDADRNWFDNFLSILKTNDLDYAFWPLIGYLRNGQGNGWALINYDLSNNRQDSLNDGNDWRRDRWYDLVNATTLKGSVNNSTNWRMINVDRGDYIKSSTIVNKKWDWDSGARKGACTDNLRLIGLSRSLHRGLCTDAVYGSQLWNSARDTVVVTNEQYVSTDWASRYTKLQCPPDHFVIGYSFRGSRPSSVVCAKSDRQGGLGGRGRTMWFDRGDSRGSGGGGDFAVQDYKGQCADDEYIAGIAYTNRVDGGAPAALYCRS